MAVATQFSVFLTNKPGEMARLAGALARAKVNVEGIAVSEGADTGVVRLVVDSVQKARGVLKRGRFAFAESRVIVIVAMNAPGSLATLAGKLAKAGVNISYIYGSTGAGPEGRLIFGVDDVKKASKLLK